jgi:hypothetical protein
MAMGPGGRGGRHPMTPPAAVAAGLAAGVVGTVSMDTLAEDLGAHLAYGAGTGTAFWVLAS